MLKNKFSRQAIAFAAIILASILLFPSASSGPVTLTWGLLAMILASNVLSLFTK